MAQDWTLLVHGGSGIITRDTLAPDGEQRARAALHRALDAGAAILDSGGSSLDAVEAAVRVLEEDSHFNAGRGAALGLDGVATLDAAIMTGDTRAAGAVAGVTCTRAPVSLARAVMDDSPHVLLAGRGADEFAAERGLEQVAPDWFVIPERAAQLEAMKAAPGGVFDTDMKYGTVGAVARDRTGHLAAATSTGGVTGKRWGRVGDSPIVGAGTWADDRACAVSATGTGEQFLRVGVGHEIAARIRLSGEALDAAVRDVLAEVRALGGTGGVIAVDADGGAVWHFTTPGMYRARANGDGTRQVAIFGAE
ncbi:beta-aspartyl-peptidase (threonine type) [Sphingomonas gellani]|uniref:Isoaspartyl peptidase n=1 Tax=Sphingomonas gellani TaxID=1166340 RepID=A0A1H8IU34_9SPHN|nr:isoaspartyl peptidase/L-asparaginase [Sphingomonas gellani]SEN71859.1 beta-aspartyl-peptidase (threonine type) [Sphingomonas gellani]